MKKKRKFSLLLASLLLASSGVSTIAQLSAYTFDPFEEPATANTSRSTAPLHWMSPIDAPMHDDQGNGEIAQAAPSQSAASAAMSGSSPTGQKPILINFNNVNIIEYIRFISRISNKNFVFDENDLQFNVTIISEEPATIENIMTALMQVIRIHGLTMIEEGNNILIHNNPNVINISRVISDEYPNINPGGTELVTQVFRLNTVSPLNASAVVKPLTSSNALVEVLVDSQHLVVTDLAPNVQRIAQLLKSVDAPNSGLVVGQYVARVTNLQLLIDQVQKLLLPIALDQPLSFIAHSTSNSIFIVSTPFIVEKSISLLQYLDSVDGSTRILDLKNLGRVPGSAGGNLPINLRKVLNPDGSSSYRSSGSQNLNNSFQRGVYSQERGGGQRESILPDGTLYPPVPKGRWVLDDNGNMLYLPDTINQPEESNTPPAGIWKVDDNGNWYFIPNNEIPQNAPPSFFNNPNGLQGPAGQWIRMDDGTWIFQLYPSASPEAAPGGTEPLIAPPIQNQFYIHKLIYRKGLEVQDALQNIATSLQADRLTEDLIQTRGNEDLINALSSIQWLETTNSLVVTGVPDALRKIQYLIEEIDTPLRQVFIEMLILQTTLDDSLSYGVNWGTRFGGGNTSGSQGFTIAGSPLQGALATTGITTNNGVATPLIPNGTTFAQQPGYNGGIIGQTITHGGFQFASIGALVDAVHDRQTVNIIMNPKIVTEDNSPAEIFVGVNTNFKTQSISNDQGSIVTNNFEFRDVGTKLKVTPYLGPTDIITLDIAQEISSIANNQPQSGNTLSEILPGPTTNVNRTSTRVHVPDGYFLILSGMIQEEQNRTRDMVPCLGCTPVVGAAFNAKRNSDAKRNLMIFIRPKIIDTIEEIQNLTAHQQNIYFIRKKNLDICEQEVNEALDWMNVKPTRPWNGCCEPCNLEKRSYRP